ncbi:hypothetical protein HN652_01070 [archaeon]|jgi:uncharacterized protein with PQ loop repeat|nr:hypothetical protein [archaeon]MBT6868917.1 hypothetical protein [archaeon]MBT7192862.1 hypothetical protein [archaeon]MBT7380828.1 hypothetical protein [archaeon]MBT7507583.1 hypothetical protein [archaeon]
MGLYLTLIISLYAVTGVVGILGYIPTIIDLIKNKSSANIGSYAIWTLCACVSFLYATFVISDLLLEIMTGLNFLSCAIILGLALRLKLNK